MDVDRFLAKPIEVEIMGEKVLIKPLTTDCYPLISKLAFYSQRIIKARNKLRPGEELDLEGLFTADELEKRAEIDKEIAYRTMDATFEDMTREKFKYMPSSIIEEIMKGALKANGLTDEKLEEIKKALTRNEKQDTGESISE
jgi:hypothetical protein